jgi:uncharacterized protein DUF1844
MAEREEEEKSRGFKVEDRRRFSAEGELKPEHQASQRPEPGAGAPESPPQSERPQGERPHGERLHPAQPPTQAAGRAPGAEPEINFTAFVVSLSTQVLMHLGEIPDPLTNQRARDLPAAQHMIDILGMLQDKTRGNLDPDEEGLLRSILFDLRMKYVETARH